MRPGSAGFRSAIAGAACLLAALGPGAAAADVPPDRRETVTVCLIYNFAAERSLAVKSETSARDRLADLRNDIAGLANIEVLDLQAGVADMDPTTDSSVAGLVRGQRDMLTLLAGYAQTNNVRIRVKFFIWEQMLGELMKESARSNDVIQIGSTYYADLLHAGRLAEIPESMRVTEHSAVPSPGPCAVPWFLDIRLLYYWRIDASGCRLPAGRFGPYIKDWNEIAFAATNRPAPPPASRPDSGVRPQDSLEYPLAIPIGKTLNLLHRYQLVTSGPVTPANPADAYTFLGRDYSAGVPRLLADLVRMDCAVVPECADPIVQERFAKGRYGMIIEQPQFMRQFQAWLKIAKQDQPAFWRESAGIAALPMTFRGGSHLALFNREGRTPAQTEKALGVLRFLAEDPSVQALLADANFLPADTAALERWIGALPTEDMREAIRAALAHSKEHPVAPYWARGVENEDMRSSLLLFWQRIKAGDPDGTVAEAKAVAARMDELLREEKYKEHRWANPARLIKVLLAVVLVVLIAGLILTVPQMYRERHLRIASEEAASRLRRFALARVSDLQGTHVCSVPPKLAKAMAITNALATFKPPDAQKTWESDRLDATVARATLVAVYRTFWGVSESLQKLPESIFLQGWSDRHQEVNTDNLRAFIDEATGLNIGQYVQVESTGTYQVKSAGMLEVALTCLIENAFKAARAAKLAVEEKPQEQWKPFTVKYPNDDPSVVIVTSGPEQVDPAVADIINTWSSTANPVLATAGFSARIGALLETHKNKAKLPIGLGLVQAFLIAATFFGGLVIEPSNGETRITVRLQRPKKSVKEMNL